MLYLLGQSRDTHLFTVCHQVSGRTRLRVPAVMQDPSLAARAAAALRELEGVCEVRANAACASLVLRHHHAFAPSATRLAQALRPVLNQSLPEVWSDSERSKQPPPMKSVQRSKQPPPVKSVQRSKQPLPVKSVQRSTSASSQRKTPPCAICQLKLKAVRWLLADVWQCWRKSWTQRLRERTAMIVAMRSS